MGILEGIEFFAATVDTGSFAGAARRLGVTSSAVSRKIAGLESELGVPLLARTTRSLSLTHDGRSFHERCLRILEELGDARDALAHVQKNPSGTIRVDAPIAFGRSVVARKLPEFLRLHPDVKVELTLRDQLMDPFAEGIDVLLRVGALRDSSLVARKLGESRLTVCASPAYLKRRGTPKTPEDLLRHECIGYLRDGRPSCWKFYRADGAEQSQEIDIQGHFHASDATVLLDAARAGHGIAILFDFMVEADFRSGALVHLLSDQRTETWPIHALYPKNRHLVPKVRVFLDFVGKLFAARRRHSG